MPRTVTRRAGGKRHPLNLRTTAATRARLEAAAVGSGRSLSQELESRIERSFTEEALVGGSVAYQTALAMVSAFNTAGRLRSGGAPPDWSDPATYSAAMLAVVEALLNGLPEATTAEDLAREMEALKGRILTRAANR